MKKIEKIQEEAIQEITKTIFERVKVDKSHGRKLPHKIITQFFNTEAPKYDSLAAVEQALHSLYKRNNIDTTVQGVKQIISSYAKRVKIAGKMSESIEHYLNEKSLTSKEKIERDKLVIQMKKYLRDFKRKYGNDELAGLYATATAITKD